MAERELHGGLCQCCERRGASGVNLVWNLGGRGSGLKKIDFSWQIFEICRFFQAISQKNPVFQANFTKKFDFFQAISPKHFNFFRQIYERFQFLEAISQKKFDFPGKNWPLTATSGQIILFLFKSHHFQTYFLYMIRYNNISRPPAQNLVGRDPPHPQDWRPWVTLYKLRNTLQWPHRAHACCRVCICC